MNDRTTGFLVLLLTLLIFYSLKPALIRARPPRTLTEGHLFVQVAGDVEFPGVYAFTRPPNLVELVERAGRKILDTVEPETFRAFTFSNGMKVMVRRDGNESNFYPGEMSSFYKMTLGIPISLNGESVTGLTALPGIGPGLAKAIVKERSKRGDFKSLDEIVSIRGIGPKLYRKIKPFLKL
jgi:competence protein ComEA